MHISWRSSLMSLLSGLILFSLFTSAQAVDTGTKTLGVWKAKDASAGLKIRGMAFGNNTYVIVGTSAGKNFIASSIDGKSWTQRSTTARSSEFTSVIFSQGRFIAVCKNPVEGTLRIWTSDNNALTWVSRNFDDKGVAGGLHAVASDGNGTVVAVGGSKFSPYPGWITVSKDNGNTWTMVLKQSEPTPFETTNTFTGTESDKLYGVGYALGNWYAFTQTITYKSSDGGTTWNSVAGSPSVDDKGYKVASSKTTVVVASSGGPQFLNKDPISGIETWEKGKPANGYGGLSSLLQAASSVIYEDGTFVLSTRDTGDIWTSETGKTWKRWTLPVANVGVYTYALCYAKRSFWCAGNDGKISKSPPWFKARLGCSSDYPYTLFDAEDGPPNRIGLPQYRVNTASLNLVLESTLFYTKTLCSPINLKLVYNSKPTPDTDANIGPFGKNWRFRYESVVGRFGQDAQIINGGGRNFAFSTPNGEDLEMVTADVKLKAPDGIFDTLVYKYHATTPSFELTLKSSHLTYIYGARGSVVNVNDSLFYLSAIKDQFMNTTTLDIDVTNGHIRTITDQSSRLFNFVYDGTSGLCIRIDMPGGRDVSFTYDSHKNLTNIYDMMDYHGSYVYDDENLGFLKSMTTAGKTTTFAYLPRPGYDEIDTLENKGDKYLSSITRPSGFGTIKYELLDDGDTVKRTDAAGQITLISNKDGQTTSIKDPLGNIRNTAFNDAKLPSSVTDGKGVCSYEYDDFGNMTKQTDAKGKSTTYEYDPIYNNVTSVINALGDEWKYTYNTKYQPLTVTTPLNNITTFTYVGKNLTNINDARSNDTSFGYDTYGNILTVSPSTSLTYDGSGLRCSSITDPNGKIKDIAWDNNDRITTVTYTSAGGVSYTNTYNAFGQINFTDELGQSASIVRDELGYITSVTDPLGYTSRTEYDADNRPTKITDPLGRASLTTYDKAGRPTVFTDTKGYKIIRSFDGVGNLISFRDKNNAETTFSYDPNSRLISTTDPLKKASSIVRDDLGRVKTSTNARGQIITYAYDMDGRLTGKTPAGSTAVTYTPDANGNITAQMDAWGTTTYAYDSYNRIQTITYPAPGSKVVSLLWKAGGQIDTITYPDGLVVTYTYDNFNRLPIPSLLKNNPGTELFGENRSTNAVTGISVKLGAAAAVNYTLTYNARGQITKMTRPNSTHSDYSYDTGGRLTQIHHSGGTDVAFTAKYAFDAVSNVTSETFSGASYYQDPTLPLKMAMTYNAAGQLTNRGGKVSVNDADGNITSVGPAGEFKCTYDAENRLIKMEQGLQTTNNTYNAEGLRVKKEVVDGDTIVYHYLPSGVLLFTTDASGTIIDRHIYAGTALISICDDSGAFIYYYGDRQAHVRIIADDSGLVLGKYDYLPYGQGQVGADPSNNVSISSNPFTFNGILGVQDEGDGIFYMQQRFYDSASARFFQKDPLGLEVGPNLYAFGNNNPIIYADPTGKVPVLVPVVLIGVSLIYWCMGSSESHEKANAESAAINAKYRAAETRRAKEQNDRYKNMSDSDRRLLMGAEDLHTSEADAVNTVLEPLEQGVNRAKEAGEIGVGTAVNAATGGLPGAALDAGGAIYTGVKNQSTEGGE